MNLLQINQALKIGERLGNIMEYIQYLHDGSYLHRHRDSMDVYYNALKDAVEIVKYMKDSPLGMQLIPDHVNLEEIWSKADQVRVSK
ncbi:hypothetical protein JK635_01980 [Neobacillus sp. YIM B02564]|uniref:DUF86 domain-containing protein n=1 Tax=Neobacillus paridis TaxID=2803862 RepID=A0ABS1TI71_9BACI|nr:hypothetical protein [Neobacillus paridis]MBL4951008.1 hypothetical protein [Neobacillus paridis]